MRHILKYLITSYLLFGCSPGDKAMNPVGDMSYSGERLFSPEEKDSVKKINNASPMVEQLTFSLIKNKIFLDSIKLKPHKEKEIILIEASRILRDTIHSVTDNKHKDFIPDDFKNVFPTIDFMLAIDAKNGHAIYFKGEIYRLLKDDDHFIEYFQLYLTIEDAIGSGLEKVTNARLCYDTPHGYCEQRTAWISQLLANYYYKRALMESDLNNKSVYLNNAVKYIKNVRMHFPTGFKSSSVTLSTSELEINLKTNDSLSK